MILDPGIQRANDRIERIFAHALTSCVEELGQSNERRIVGIEIERPVSNAEHPTMKAVLARLPSEAWRQMKRLPEDRRVAIAVVIMRGPPRQHNLGKRRSKQV